MGCFLACFGSSKYRKQRKRRHKVQPRENQRNTSYNSVSVQSTVSSVQEYSDKPVTPLSEVGVKSEEQSSSTGARKRVTFDANVKTYEHVLPEKVTDIFPETVEDAEKEKEEKSVKSNQSNSTSEASSITSSSGSYPTNHRYQNYRESDDELDCDDDDLDDYDDDDDDEVLDYDDIYEDDKDGIVESAIARRKLGPKKIDSSMVTSGLDDGGGVKPIMFNRTARDRSGYVHSVLNPVENLAQWKAVKARGKPQLKQQKENFTMDEEHQRASFSMEPGFKELSLSFKSKPEHQSKKANQEITVDASLSNWLSSSETTPINKSNSTVSLTTSPAKIMSQGSTNSTWSQEDRPILGALTLEEIKQFSASSSPRKSPSRSPDEMPIIGTVGTYWSPTSSTKDSGSISSYKGIPNTTSKYREDMKVNWHSTPFETRLERALNRGAAAAYSTTHL